MENHEKFLQVMHDFDKENDYGLDSQGRIKISIFYSENTNCWLSEAEMIFSRNRLSEAEKIEAATACFGDNAGEWFQLVDRRQAVRTWEELKGLMIDRFRSSQEANVSASEEFEKHHRQSSEIPTLAIQDSMNQSWEVVDGPNTITSQIPNYYPLAFCGRVAGPGDWERGHKTRSCNREYDNIEE